MILLRRFLPVLTALLVLAGFELLLAHPQWYHVISGVVVLLSVVAVGSINGWRERSTALLMIAPALLSLGIVVLLLFVEVNHWVVRHGTVLLSATFLWHYLEQVFAYRFDRIHYQAFALENTSAYMNLGSVFCILTGLFGVRLFLGYPVWAVLLLTLVILFLAAYHTFAMSKIAAAPRLRAAALAAILTTELASAATTLPVDHFVTGLLLTTFYYVVTSLLHYYHHGTLDAQRVRKYIVLGGIVVCLTLLTASWR